MHTPDPLEGGPLLWYLLRMKEPFQPKRRSPNGTIKGCCPFHDDHNPSAVYYPPPDERFKCYSSRCGVFYRLPRLIAVREFGYSFEQPLDERIDARKAQVLAAFQEDGGVLFDETTLSHNSMGIRSALSLPGPLQRHILTQLTDWWHDQLIGPSRGAKQAREYLKFRGVSEEVIGARVLGYMPKPGEVSQTERDRFNEIVQVSSFALEAEQEWYRASYPQFQFHQSLFTHLDDARALAHHLGILGEDGSWFLRNRLVFSCTSQAGTRYFHTRLPHEPDEAEKPFKFYGCPHLAKFPFVMHLWMIPGRRKPRFQATLETEGAFGPAVAMSQALVPSAVAVLGAGTPVFSWYEGLPRPHLVATDNDSGKYPEVDPATLPGERLATQLLTMFHNNHIEAYRLIPDPVGKGFDEWPKYAGIDTIEETIQQVLGQNTRQWSQQSA